MPKDGPTVIVMPPKRNMSAPGAARKGGMPLEDLPPIGPQDAKDEPAHERLFVEEERPSFTISTVVEFGGRKFTITATGTTVERFNELLNKRKLPPPADPAERQQEAPICQYHGPMKPSGKAPGTWYCTAKMGNGEYCKEKA